MTYAFIHAAQRPFSRSRGFHPSDDPLDAMRGILFGTLLSMLGFWLPLVLFLTR
jgi:hypothetical protein